MNLNTKICTFKQNKMLYSDSMHYELWTFVTLVILHTFIKNMFLYKNPRSIHQFYTVVHFTYEISIIVGLNFKIIYIIFLAYPGRH